QGLPLPIHLQGAGRGRRHRAGARTRGELRRRRPDVRDPRRQHLRGRHRSLREGFPRAREGGAPAAQGGARPAAVRRRRGGRLPRGAHRGEAEETEDGSGGGRHLLLRFPGVRHHPHPQAQRPRRAGDHRREQPLPARGNAALRPPAGVVDGRGHLRLAGLGERAGEAQVTQTVLVTGGAGFIGSNLVRLLRRERPDWTVVNLDKLTYAGNAESLAELREDEKHAFVRGDILDAELVNRLISDRKVDVILNLAAESHVDRSILGPAIFVETNVSGTQVLLEAARQAKVRRFVQVSTDEVYGSLGATGRFSESSPLRPSSPYSASKAAADLLALAYGHTFGMDVVVTRSSNNYGPYQFPEKLIPLMIANALEGRRLPVYGDGLQIRDWIHVEDHNRALIAALERGRGGEVYNLGADNEMTNIETVKMICDLM